MNISAISSGYSVLAQAQPIKTTSETSFIQQKTAVGPNAQTANNAYGSTKSFNSPLSSDMYSVLLQQQEMSQPRLQSIASKYDVTNLSGNERVSLSQELRDNGLISSGAHLALVAPLSMNEDLSAKTNYLETTREAFEFALQHGVSGEQLAIQKEQLDILEKLAVF